MKTPAGRTGGRLRAWCSKDMHLSISHAILLRRLDRSSLGAPLPDPIAPEKSEPAKKGRAKTSADGSARRSTMPGGSLSRHRVRHQIERMILSGELKSQQRLTQMDLAKRFDVAQSVVREALLELQIGGLVRTVDNVGVFVCNMGSNRLIQAYQIREVFEGLAARLCCEHATRADVQEMYQLADRNYDFGRRGEADLRSQSDRDFHFRIVVASRNDMLAQLTDSYRTLGMVVRTDRNLETVYAEHRAIVRAIEDQRADKAERLAREHARAALQVIHDGIEKGTFVPQWVLPAT